MTELEPPEPRPDFGPPEFASAGAPLPAGEVPSAAPRSDIVAALSYGWRAFTDHLGPMIIVVLVPVAVQLILAIVERVLVHSIARWFLLQLIVGVIVGSIAGIGVPRLALVISRGEPPDVGAAFRYERLGGWILFSVVFGLIEGIGIVLCVIPGLLFLAYFGLAPYYFLDRGMGIGEALGASREAIVRKGLAFPVLFSFVVGFAGFAVLGVGALVTQSIAALALVFLYRYAVDEPIVEPAATA